MLHDGAVKAAKDYITEKGKFTTFAVWVMRYEMSTELRNGWQLLCAAATGVICGGFMARAAFIGNLFVMLINFVIDIFVVLWNFIAVFVRNQIRRNLKNCV